MGGPAEQAGADRAEPEDGGGHCTVGVMAVEAESKEEGGKARVSHDRIQPVERQIDERVPRLYGLEGTGPVA